MTDLIYKTEVTSTSEAVLEHIMTATDSIALYSFNQTKGRGQYGSNWQIIAQQNLAYSLAIQVNNFSMDDVNFNYHTALIVRNFLAKMTQEIVQIKWPNDIIIKQKKVCGILLEKKKIKHNTYYIIGIGINILQEDYSQLPKAGSILSTTHQRFDLKTFTEEFHNYLVKYLKSSFSSIQILDAFNTHLFRKDEISVFSKSDIRQNGIIKYADEHGYLWIDFEKDGLERVFHKQVELLY